MKADLFLFFTVVFVLGCGRTQKSTDPSPSKHNAALYDIVEIGKGTITDLSSLKPEPGYIMIEVRCSSDYTGNVPAMFRMVKMRTDENPKRGDRVWLWGEKISGTCGTVDPHEKYTADVWNIHATKNKKGMH